MLVLLSRFKDLIIEFEEGGNPNNLIKILRDEQICLEKLKPEEVPIDAYQLETLKVKGCDNLKETNFQTFTIILIFLSYCPNFQEMNTIDTCVNFKTGSFRINVPNNLYIKKGNFKFW